ncbi:MAG TPA: methyltransferase domain-containing protein [Candidatus Obscuribacterales bacterium]
MSCADAKADNQAHWDLMAPRWKAWWYRYGPASQPVSDYLVQQAGLLPGARVLDLATGMGEPALSFARAVGPGGEVLGIDQSVEMIKYACEMAADAGLANLRFEVQDVEQLELPGEAPFDALVSRWGLMFCTDVVATLANARRYLAVGGRLLAAVWSRPEEVPMLELAGSVIQETLGIELTRPGPGPFTLADPDYLAQVLEAGGFRLERLEKVDVVLPCDSAQHYLLDRASISPLLEDVLARLSPEQRTRYDEALEVAIDPWRQGDAIALVNKAICVVAKG